MWFFPALGPMYIDCPSTCLKYCTVSFGGIISKCIIVQKYMYGNLCPHVCQPLTSGMFRCFSTLLRYMSVEVLRESACDCIHEIIMKGMDPMAKKELVESLLSVLEKSGILMPQEV